MEEYYHLYRNINIISSLSSTHDVISYCSNIIDDDQADTADDQHVKATSSTATTFHHDHHDGHENKMKNTDGALEDLAAKIFGQDYILKSNITSHPAFPHLLDASIQCQKVGAPPEKASLLEEIIGRENHIMNIDLTTTSASNSTTGWSTSQLLRADPELDRFMESFSEILQRFKEELSMTFNETTTFLSDMSPDSAIFVKPSCILFIDMLSDEGENNLKREMSMFRTVDIDYNIEELTGAKSGEQDLKEMLMRKYNGQSEIDECDWSVYTTFLIIISTPYDMTRLTNIVFLIIQESFIEEEKMKLSEETGLHQKQINNWFVNSKGSDTGNPLQISSLLSRMEGSNY
ncbi:Octamer-binding transcription factor [Trema orientale]|uniref:Octamer-binding transcription factor n=1 Tax=Trema orientale TaxID=63057 RepID=A0A2P5C978_TREOI|nr:Octamer-binding transcription factor [Trema orientale]